MPRNVVCPYCNKKAELATGRVIYPHRQDLYYLFFWRCEPCEAYVGCHKSGDGKNPLGTLANAETREARKKAHAAFDPLWQEGHLSRNEAYKMLSQKLGLGLEETHISQFQHEMCLRVVQAVEEFIAAK